MMPVVATNLLPMGMSLSPSGNATLACVAEFVLAHVYLCASAFAQVCVCICNCTSRTCCAHRRFLYFLKVALKCRAQLTSRGSMIAYRFYDEQGPKPQAADCLVECCPSNIRAASYRPPVSREGNQLDRYTTTKWGPGCACQTRV